MAGDYRYLVVDASTGKNLCEIPLTVTGPISRVMNGAGTLNGWIPIDHPTATAGNLEGDREITVIRDSVPIWNGPITNLLPGWRSGVVQVGASEASVYFTQRTLEINKNYNADLYTIMRDLFTYAVTKTSTAGDGTAGAGLTLNAALPRFSISPAAGGTLSGVIKKYAYPGASRRLIADIYAELVADPTTGLDYRMDYTTGSSRQTCQRTFTMASPSIGVTRTQPLTEHVLYDYGYAYDRMRAANRAHTVGNGFTYTLTNTGSIAAGDILIERVWDRSDTKLHASIQDFTREARRVAQPPVRTPFASFVPSSALPFGFCDLGDKVPINISAPSILALNGSRRVVQIDVTPPTSNDPEIVALSFNLPLDALGA